MSRLRRKLEQGVLYQYEEVYAVIKAGKISRRRIRKDDCGPVGCTHLSCVNGDFLTDYEWNIIEPRHLTKSHIFFKDNKLWLETED